MLSELNRTPEQDKAFNYYKKNSMSIEILKDDCLQKVNFRVRNKVIDEEYTESVQTASSCCLQHTFMLTYISK